MASMSAEQLITAEEFAQKLALWCLRGDGELPRKSRDLHILLTAASLWMEPGVVYAEREVTEKLGEWLDSVCPALKVDAVTLRRELVDRLYLDRDAAGTHYSAGPGPREWRFEDEVSRVDPIAVVQKARADREERRRAWEARQRDDA